VTVKWYAGSEKCYDNVWFGSFCSLTVIVILFLFVLFRLSRLTPRQRNSRSSEFISLTRPYSQECWYWEFVILSRRLLIALITTISYVNSNFLNLSLISVLSCYLGLHVYKKPFLHTRNNRLESLCLFFLINISTAVNLTTLKDTQSLFIKWFLVICILTPFIIFGYHVITLWYAEENKYKKITMRKTTSTVDALALQMNEEIPSGNTDGKTNDGQNNMNTTNNGMFF